MGNRDWERFGEEISRNVQEAIDSQDYSMLNRTILDSVNGAMDYVSHTVRSAGNAVNENLKKQQETRRQQTYGWNQQSWQSGVGQGYHYAGRDEGVREQKKATPLHERQEARNLYATTTGSHTIGILLAVLGFLITFPFLVTTLMGLFMGIFAGDPEAGGIIAASLPFVIICGGVGIWGTKMLGRVRRFRSYIRVLGNREYCDVKELEEQTGKAKKFIIRDLEKMIQKGWFQQGHLDTGKTCFMVSNQAYQQYNDLMHRMEVQDQERKEREKEQELEALRRKSMQQKAEENRSCLPPEVQETIKAGEAYLCKIRACNDAIPGEEISAKISRIELLVDKIFDRVEQNPAIVSDLRRMMEYYLPTTVKLLEAYENLDQQPVQGENIVSSKQEIEKTLDTLNVAFEKLLDSLFQDTAWDVSSDISVLHTMLAQEGLTEDEWKRK